MYVCAYIIRNTYECTYSSYQYFDLPSAMQEKHKKIKRTFPNEFES